MKEGRREGRRRKGVTRLISRICEGMEGVGERGKWLPPFFPSKGISFLASFLLISEFQSTFKTLPVSIEGFWKNFFYISKPPGLVRKGKEPSLETKYRFRNRKSILKTNYKRGTFFSILTNLDLDVDFLFLRVVAGGGRTGPGGRG